MSDIADVLFLIVVILLLVWWSDSRSPNACEQELLLLHRQTTSLVSQAHETLALATAHMRDVRERLLVVQSTLVQAQEELDRLEAAVEKLREA